MIQLVFVVSSLLLNLTHAFFNLAYDKDINTTNSVTLSHAQGNHLFLGASDADFNVSFYYFDSEALSLVDLRFHSNNVTSLRTLPTNTNSTGYYSAGSYANKEITVFDVGSQSIWIQQTAGRLIDYTFSGIEYSFYYIEEETSNSSSLSRLQWTTGTSITSSYSGYTFEKVEQIKSKIFINAQNVGNQKHKLIVFDEITLTQLYVVTVCCSKILFQMCDEIFLTACQDKIQIRNSSNPFNLEYTLYRKGGILAASCVGTNRIVLYGSDQSLLLYDFATGTLLESIASPITYTSNLKLHPISTSFEGLWMISDKRIFLYGKPNEKFKRVKQFTQILGNILIFASLKTTFKLFVPLWIFIEDICLLRHHPDNQYPSQIKQLMEEGEKINKLRLSKHIFNKIVPNFQINSSKNLQTEYNKFSYLQNSGKNGLVNVQFYFLEAAKYRLTYQLLASVFFFSVLRILSLTVSPISLRFPSNKILDKIQRGLKNRTCFWMLIYACIDFNLTELCFNCFNQLSLPFCFGWESRLNIMASILVLFVAVIYALVGYVMARKLSYSASLNLIAFSKNSRKSFFLQGYIYSLSRLLRGLCHSNIFYSHYDKIRMLTGLECSLIICIFYLKRSFTNRLAFVFHLLYYGGLLFFDIFNLVEGHFTEIPFTLSSIQTTRVAVMILILAATMGKFFVSMARSIKSLIGLLSSQNSIKPETDEQENKEGDQIDSSKIKRIQIIKNKLKKAFKTKQAKPKNINFSFNDLETKTVNEAQLRPSPQNWVDMRTSKPERMNCRRPVKLNQNNIKSYPSRNNQMPFDPDKTDMRIRIRVRDFKSNSRLK